MIDYCNYKEYQGCWIGEEKWEIKEQTNINKNILIENVFKTNIEIEKKKRMQVL